MKSQGGFIFNFTCRSLKINQVQIDETNLLRGFVHPLPSLTQHNKKC